MLVNYISIVLYFSVVLTSTKASLMDTSFNTWLVKTRCFVSPACMKLFFFISLFFLSFTDMQKAGHILS